MCFICQRRSVGRRLGPCPLPPSSHERYSCLSHAFSGELFVASVSCCSGAESQSVEATFTPSSSHCVVGTCMATGLSTSHLLDLQVTGCPLFYLVSRCPGGIIKSILIVKTVICNSKKERANCLV